MRTKMNLLVMESAIRQYLNEQAADDVANSSAQEGQHRARGCTFVGEVERCSQHVLLCGVRTEASCCNAQPTEQSALAKSCGTGGYRHSGPWPLATAAG
jgi:hypothetical protein